MDPGRLAAVIIQWAEEVGFDQVGVATLEPARTGGALRRWLQRGDHADMAYMERRLEARLAPSTLVAGARSVVCVAWRYHPLSGDGQTGDNDLWQGVARYSRGRDYHDAMQEMLDRLASKVVDYFPGVECRRYVDTGPVLERELAQRSGLGVVGKNTCLLHRDHGSYVLLGELFLSLELAPPAMAAPAVTDLCGSCTLCLDACPTGALPEPFRLDARRCISYWTIEHRGDLPEEVRSWLGEWVFGCDVCQEVCPWNRRRIVEVERPELNLAAAREEIDLTTLLFMDEASFGRVFSGSPMKRAKLEGLQRNAAVAMGNRGDGSYREPLRRAATEHPSSLVRRHAEWALRRTFGDSSD